MSTLNLGKTELHYDQSGAGRDVLWLAAGDHPGHNWRQFQTPAFDQRYRSTTYDARGVGQTISSEPAPWPIEAHALDAAALIEAVCEPPVALIGLSMGSLISVQLAHDRPDLVSAVMAMGTCVRKTGFIREWEQSEIDLRRNRNEMPSDFAIAHYALIYYPAEVLGDDELWQKVKPLVAADFGDRDGDMLAEQWQACLDYDSTDLLPKVQAPIHAIAFSQDVQTPPKRVREVADLAANGHFHLLEGLGHGSAFGHRPDTVNQKLLSILDAM